MNTGHLLPGLKYVVHIIIIITVNNLNPGQKCPPIEWLLYFDLPRSEVQRIDAEPDADVFRGSMCDAFTTS
jgi:hypothetical protein